MTTCLLCGAETERVETRRLQGLFGTADAWICAVCDEEARADLAERRAHAWAFDSRRDNVRLMDDDSHAQ